MARIRPFRGIRPTAATAPDLIAPPYDTLDRAEARAAIAANPLTFLHVTRSDGLLPDTVDEHDPAIYAEARRQLARFREAGWVVQDAAPSYYLYRQTWRGRTQTGLMATCAVAEYDDNTIKRHELTRPDKEKDRVDHIEALDAQTGLVFLAWRDTSAEARAALAEAPAAPLWETTTPDGVTHALLRIDAPAAVARITAAFAALPALYVADGHHRSAAASRVAAARGGAGASGWFLAGIFPDSELEILPYNRLVKDLAGHSPAAFLAAVDAAFHRSPGQPTPAGRGEISMFFAGAWHALRPHPSRVPSGDPVGSLDVSVLQDTLLGPVLGIANPRTDTRIRFVGGIKGPGALEAAVQKGEAAVGFVLHPTGMDQLLAVADANLLMPPKSTWFEPKLRGGVVVHPIDAD
jgi:uncharacterized protein (DUF1015 family)